MKPFVEPSIGRRTRGLQPLGLTVALLAGLACSSPDVSGPSSLDRAHLPWMLTLNAEAVTMDTAAPYNTLQLTAVPRTIDGTALADSVLPTFTSSDSSVRVSATGLLTARAEVYNVQVIATLVYRGVRVADTATVNVTALGTPPKIQRLQLAVQPGDSAKIAIPSAYSVILYGISAHKTLNVGVRDTTGTLIPSALVTLQTSDPLQLTINDPYTYRYTTTDNSVDFYPQPTRPLGTATVYASATTYGVALRDSFKIRITDQLVKIFTIAKPTPGNTAAGPYTIQPDTQVIGVGGWMYWANATSPKDSLDIVFDDPTAAFPDLMILLNTGGGNIAPFPGGTIKDSVTDFLKIIRSRHFPRAGQFHFHSPRTGVSGTVIVR